MFVSCPNSLVAAWYKLVMSRCSGYRPLHITGHTYLMAWSHATRAEMADKNFGQLLVGDILRRLKVLLNSFERVALRGVADQAWLQDFAIALDLCHTL